MAAVVVRRAMLRWLLLAHGLALASGLRVNEPASLAGEYEDTPADFAPLNYEVTALGVLAASCPCEWATDSSPIHKGWLWDRILIVDDEVCANSCTAPVAACAAQLANASGLLVTDRYNPSYQFEGEQRRDPRLKGDFAANDPSINATCQVAIPTAYVNSSIISLLAAAKLVSDAPRLPPLIWSASQIRCSAPSPAPPCRSTVAWSVGRRAMRTSHAHAWRRAWDSHGTHRSPCPLSQNASELRALDTAGLQALRPHNDFIAPVALDDLLSPPPHSPHSSLAITAANLTMSHATGLHLGFSCDKYMYMPLVYLLLVPVWWLLTVLWTWNTYRAHAASARDLHRLLCWVPTMQFVHGTPLPRQLLPSDRLLSV